MMLKMNLYSCLVLGAAVLITGELFEFIAFVRRHPDLLVHLASFAVTSALGQNFIFMTISHFGPLVCSLVTTTRKFFTILGKSPTVPHIVDDVDMNDDDDVFSGIRANH